MTKQILGVILITTLFAINSLNAQFSTFKKGETQASFGVGIVPTFLGKTAVTEILPLNATFGVRVSDNVVVSAYAGYTKASTVPSLVNDGILSVSTNNYVMGGLRAEFHTNYFEKLDFYGGSMLSYGKAIVDHKNATTSEPIDLGPSKTNPYQHAAPKGSLIPSGFVGAAYYFRSDMAVYSEVGFGISIFNVGLTARL